MTSKDMPLDTLLTHLAELAQNNLALWDLPNTSKITLINVSENATYRVQTPDNQTFILRVHRAAYHSVRAIECELAWLDALDAAGVIPVPRALPGRNGKPIQTARSAALDAHRHMVLFDFIPGSAPDETGDMSPGFTELGQIAAKCHLHAISWARPDPFERLIWDADAVFGASPTWGDWRDAPGITPATLSVLEQVETRIKDRLAHYGKSADRYNLIHADMRFANLLQDQSGTKLIDFDDCGQGWLMYDFAAAISFVEDDPRVPDFKQAWLAGYQSLRPLSQDDIAEIDTMIMLRRMALLAWVGSHIEAPEPQELAPHFATNTATLGQRYLNTGKVS